MCNRIKKCKTNKMCKNSAETVQKHAALMHRHHGTRMSHGGRTLLTSPPQAQGWKPHKHADKELIIFEFCCLCVCVLLTNFKQISAQSVKESSKEKTISSHYAEMSLLKHHHVLVPSSEVRGCTERVQYTRSTVWTSALSLLVHS